MLLAQGKLSGRGWEKLLHLPKEPANQLLGQLASWEEQQSFPTQRQSSLLLTGIIRGQPGSRCEQSSYKEYTGNVDSFIPSFHPINTIKKGGNYVKRYKAK